MIVADYMTRKVITIAPDTAISEAAKLMLEHKVSGLPVVDGRGHIVGIVSERDLLRRRADEKREQRPHWLQLLNETAGSTGEVAQFQSRKVNEVMTPDPATVAASASLKEASRLIEQHGFKRLPVVENGKLVGIIARADLVRALAHGRNGAVAPTLDVSVLERLRELERQNWRNRARVIKPF
jgi:CBS-domain-containing membrane protein